MNIISLSGNKFAWGYGFESRCSISRYELRNNIAPLKKGAGGLDFFSALD